jgi:hypothetical protein
MHCTKYGELMKKQSSVIASIPTTSLWVTCTCKISTTRITYRWDVTASHMTTLVFCLQSNWITIPTQNMIFSVWYTTYEHNPAQKMEHNLGTQQVTAQTPSWMAQAFIETVNSITARIKTTIRSASGSSLRLGEDEIHRIFATYEKLWKWVQEAIQFFKAQRNTRKHTM